MGGMKKMDPDSSQWWPLKGDDHKLKYRKSHLSVIKRLFCKDGPRVEQAALGARVACISPCLEVLKTQLDKTLSNLSC